MSLYLVQSRAPIYDRIYFIKESGEEISGIAIFKPFGGWRCFVPHVSIGIPASPI